MWNGAGRGRCFTWTLHSLMCHVKIGVVRNRWFMGYAENGQSRAN